MEICWGINSVLYKRKRKNKKILKKVLEVVALGCGVCPCGWGCISVLWYFPGWRSLCLCSGWWSWSSSLWRAVQRPIVDFGVSVDSIGDGNGTRLQFSCLKNPMDGRAWQATVHGVAKSQTGLSNFTLTFPFHALEKEMASHSSVLTWRIPGTGEPGGLLSMGLHRVGHNWSDLAAAAAFDLLHQLCYITGAMTSTVPIRVSFCLVGLWISRHKIQNRYQ